ncbi:MAG: hypothetical protein IPQ18_04050 [Saprospiraceae bacterium]|nr:hypothetical protein [Saprospiraceae bacterium]
MLVGKTSNSENTSDERYQGKIVVLIDESCNIESDIVAMACRSNPNTTLVGSATSGSAFHFIYAYPWWKIYIFDDLRLVLSRWQGNASDGHFTRH